MTLSVREITDALAAAGLEPTYSLGQNFMVDANTVRRIVRLADIGPADRVLEVGAGLGSLTVALADTGASVTAVEIDRALIPILDHHVAGSGVRVVTADAMSLDWDELLGTDESEGGWVLVANLPYNIGTPLVADLLDEVPAIERMLVLVQLEVAERLTAPAGHKARGALSVKVEHHAVARIVGRVPNTVFYPRPKVESGLVELRRRPAPGSAVDPELLFGLVGRAFGQRRKMVRASLSGLIDADGFAAAGVDPTARPQTLELGAWYRLAELVAAAGGGS